MAEAAKRTATRSLDADVPQPHPAQRPFVESPAKRKVVRGGRRGGKTVGAAIPALKAFLAGQRVLYATPTQEQVDRFWETCKRALQKAIDAGIVYKNETRHVLELSGTETRIRAKTAYDADTLRGDYADLLILDEYQDMKPSAWEQVGAPMLLDNNGDAIFIYTPKRIAKHARELRQRAEQDKSGRWATFHFKSDENPYLSREALSEITQDMTAQNYRQEIEAEDIEDAPGALWRRESIDHVTAAPELSRIVVGVDPSATSGGDECGIVVVGMKAIEGKPHLYVLDDRSLRASPEMWAREVVAAYNKWKADSIIAEQNNGGEMVRLTIQSAGANTPVRLVSASRGKQTRAEPVSVVYEQGRGHHVGAFAALEDELCWWTPGDASPNRLDALVWAAVGVGAVGLASVLTRTIKL